MSNPSDSTAASPIDSVATIDAFSRSPWKAGLLALFFGTVGQVYCGHFRRVFIFGLLFALEYITVFCLLLYFPYGRAALFISLILYLAYTFVLVADAVRLALHQAARRRWYQQWWFYIGFYAATTMIGIAIASATRLYWEEAYVMPTGSMKDTLILGDRFLVDKIQYGIRPIHRGEVVLYWADEQMMGAPYSSVPASTAQRQRFVKRVIGIPGDTIEIRDEKVIRNGEPLDEPYANLSGELTRQAPEMVNMPPRTVPDGQYFVLGDQRRQSRDSRLVGCVDEKDIIGKVVLIYWSRELLESPKLPGAFATPESPPVPGKLRWSRFGMRIE